MLNEGSCDAPLSVQNLGVNGPEEAYCSGYLIWRGNSVRVVTLEGGLEQLGLTAGEYVWVDFSGKTSFSCGITTTKKQKIIHL